MPASSSSDVPPPGWAERASEIAQRLTIGAGLMASGDIAAARFERVAEAGEAAGAFALAETYAPVVLAALRPRGGITANCALAQRWYERAGDLGAAAAPERIARLAQILK
jgi:TPR repeat protein